ncbi:MAG: arginine--tRNA ligase [Candidatus Diapherotrites archaeon]|uniref:Arginine--tRNA ligase n=1 Tax=Candidatus Iainarchaeum sp. TaxID=3101447 RepID=A0A2D6LQI4_9ARCH|nr:arginine--tRNA ligase [Candidatus Diapherotrites archaeon]|tara:strand:+ start:7771 stop:9462 length:1692 start_codon:yes stop_codon:yes gene_type:complete
MDFRKELLKALSKAGIKKPEELLEQPPQREMGDYALPCFRLTKEFKKSPNEIASDFKEKIKLPKAFTKAEAKGPYLNFFLDEKTFAKNTIEKILKEKNAYGLEKKKGPKIIVEYCQANPMKAFHIGHIRNICLGESISRIFEASGVNVSRVNYGGDVGPHVSKTLYAYQNLNKKKIPEKIEEKGAWLGNLYTQGAKAVKENPELEQKMRDMVVELEAGNKKLVKDWEKLRKMSLGYFDTIYDSLNTKFDNIILESEVEKEGIKIAKQLQKEKFAYEDEGALLVDLTKYNLEKFLVLKSDGAALYSTKDMALAKMKKQKLKADKTYNVVGSEQKFYFQQLIKTISLMNKKKNEFCETKHVSYELVRLEGGKMASREGNVITYAELFNTIFEKTYKETKSRHKDWSEKKISENAKQIGLAAIKFGMLGHDKNKVIIFNWEKATSLEGETGPFIQYSYARAKSILKKAKKTKPGSFSLTHEKEKGLVSILANYENKVKEAKDSISPHKIAYYLIELASAFNSFYHEVRVLDAEEKLIGDRVALVESVSQVLQNGMDLLNIKAIDEM